MAEKKSNGIPFGRRVLIAAVVGVLTSLIMNMNTDSNGLVFGVAAGILTWFITSPNTSEQKKK